MGPKAEEAELGWYLEEVAVTSEGQDKQSFPGNCWLGKSDAGDFDGARQTMHACSTAACPVHCTMHAVKHLGMKEVTVSLLTRRAGFPERNLIPCKNTHSMAVVQEQLLSHPLEVCPLSVLSQPTCTCTSVQLY